jgi:hypothetical protein
VRRAVPWLVAGSAIGFGTRRAYRLVAGGALTLDLDLGRRLRPLGPLVLTIAAPREVVFEVIAAPYLGRTPRALADKLQVWERSSDMVLAAHFTEVKCGTTTTVETVPHLSESFLLRETETGSELRWQGELGTDGWGLGEWWGRTVARAWTRAVDESLREIAAEAERRTSSGFQSSKSRAAR